MPLLIWNGLFENRFSLQYETLGLLGAHVLCLFEIPNSIVANNNGTDFSAEIAIDTHTSVCVRTHNHRQSSPITRTHSLNHSLTRTRTHNNKQSKSEPLYCECSTVSVDSLENFQTVRTSEKKILFFFAHNSETISMHSIQLRSVCDHFHAKKGKRRTFYQIKQTIFNEANWKCCDFGNGSEWFFIFQRKRNTNRQFSKLKAIYKWSGKKIDIQMWCVCV